MNKILSVIIPSYNSRKWLEKCLESFICEALDKIEVIIVNDGSTDGSEQIAAEFTKKYPRSFILENKENGGHGSAINTGVRLASGKYIKVIDADDWINTQNLPEFTKLLENTDADTVLTHHHTIDESTGEIKCWRSYPDTFGRKYSLDEIMCQWKSFDRSLTFHGITYNREFYLKNAVKLSEHVFYEDHEYATIPCCFSESVVPFDIFIYEYRVGDVSQSVSAQNQVKRISHVITVVKRLVSEKHRLDNLSKEDGRLKYYNAKLHHLMLSFLQTSLICDSDRKNGRKRAADLMNFIKDNCPGVYNSVMKHYRIMKAMNRLHINNDLYQKILASEFYNKVRKNHNFS